jgi:NhaA family Na+:H+ antiporter
VFAFFAAGVTVSGAGLGSSIMLGIVAALVVGKTIGITGATWLVQRFTRARLAEGLSWWDVVGLAMLGGIGFTVSLLIGELAYRAGTERGRPAQDRRPARLGDRRGSRRVWRMRNRHYRRLCEMGSVDADADGVPDVYRDPA